LPRSASAGDRGAGALYALTAYGIWGFAPIYWVETRRFPAPELLAWRVLASLGTALLFVAMLRSWREFGAALRSSRSAGSAILAGLLLGLNWGIFIFAVQQGRILETSLGYYINPLVNVLLGLLILGERLSRAQTLAVLLATLGVAIQAIGQGTPPWIALALAGSFGVYGLVRKLGPAAPLVGFAIEALTLAPLAGVYLLHLSARGDAAVPGASPGMQWLVAGSGPLTALPLLAFASAARRLPLSSLGMFQYLAPTLSFLLAIGVYGEPFTRNHALCFACVWLALALYFWDSLQRAPQLPSVRPGRDPVSLGGPT
jgi:chloramphenicol-sensitive protein RarD